jgi:hypothetical protein
MVREGLLLIAASVLLAAGPPDASSLHKEVITKYCVTCHNQRLKTAGLMLDTLDV